MRRLRLLYPLLFAIFPIVALAAPSPGQYQLQDVLILVGMFAIGAALVFATVLMLLRVRLPGRQPLTSHPEDLAAAIALIGVGCFHLYLPAQVAVGLWAPILTSAPWWPLTMAAATIGLIVWACVRQAVLPSLGRFMTIFGGVLVVWSGIRLGVNEVRAGRVARSSALVQELSRPVPAQASGASELAMPQRDIYLIILDSYANAAVLRERFGFDNRSFEDSLRALGFRIPASVRSNYAQTALSLPSLLNFEHLTALASEAGAESEDVTSLTHLTQNSRAARFLREQGYRIVLFPSAWWEPTQRSAYAHELFKAFPEFNLDWEFRRSDLRRKLGNRTMFGLSLRGPSESRAVAEHVRRSFHGLKAIPSRAEPTFTFAHFLVPHAPYIMDAACRERFSVRVDKSHATAEERQAYREWLTRQAYIAQLECVNRLTLDLVTALITRSATPPIIILQSDHGSAPSVASLEPLNNPRVLPTPEQARERFGAFGAYYLPGGGERALPDSVTPVNVLRYVFGYYFGADLPPRKDALYFSRFARPYKFFRLDDAYRIAGQRSDDATIAWGKGVAAQMGPEAGRAIGLNGAPGALTEPKRTWE